jgi:hypothetical protein
MKIIGIKAYKNGYTGFAEEPDKYVFFSLSRKRGLKKLIEYDKGDFFSYERFLSVMARFVRLGFFLKKPITVGTLTIEELKKHLGSGRVF